MRVRVRAAAPGRHLLVRPRRSARAAQGEKSGRHGLSLRATPSVGVLNRAGLEPILLRERERRVAVLAYSAAVFAPASTSSCTHLVRVGGRVRVRIRVRVRVRVRVGLGLAAARTRAGCCARPGAAAFDEGAHGVDRSPGLARGTGSSVRARLRDGFGSGLGRRSGLRAGAARAP